MNDDEFNRLISDSLKQFADSDPDPPYESEHVFSKQFEKQMSPLLYRKEHHRFPLHRKWFVLITALLTMLSCSLTAYGSKTNQIHFFADNFPEYSSLGDVDENLPERMDLIYGLDELRSKYTQGVDIHNDEQYTRFFIDEDTGLFLEFSSYPKSMFRYHVSSDFLTEETISLENKQVICYQAQNGMYYILWSMETSVFVVRSNFEKTELIDAVNSIEVYETPLQ